MSQPITVGINGFGRIGRTLFKKIWDNPYIQVVAINDIAPVTTMAHLLKYDSIHGIFPPEVKSDKNKIIVEDKEIRYSAESDLKKLDWENVDIVVECTGKFKKRSQLEIHHQNGGKKIILAVPPEDDSIKTIVLGVNDHLLNNDDIIISNASCTTNNAAPMLQVIHSLCEIEQAYITTVHSYTTDQSLHDQPHKDLRRARAAGQSIVPTTTGAAKALTKIFPDLASVIGGCGIRVPVANGSLTDVTLNVKKESSIKEVNEAFKKASENELKGILQYTDIPLVSVDIVGNSHSCIFDSGMTSVIGKMIKIIGWYDNESGYSSRIVDLILQLSRK